MAKFTPELPTEIIEQVKSLDRNSTAIFGGMTRAGAEKAGENLRQRASQALKGTLAGKVNSKLKITKTYNNKKHEIVTAAKFYGYIPVKRKPFYLKVHGKKYGPYPGLPVPLLLNLIEGGLKSTDMPEPFKKHWRTTKYRIKDPAFSDTKGITDAMLKAQEELSGGLLK